MRETMRVTAKDTAELRFVLDTTSTTTGGGAGGGVVGGVVSGFGGGIGGGSVTNVITAPPPPPTPAAINRITEAVAKPNLVASAPPAYPPLARAARVEGAVVLQVEVSIEGRVQNVSLVSGNALLNEAAIQAVRQWTYKPFVLNGQAIPVTTTATVNFTLP
jgi:protein TonB